MGSGDIAWLAALARTGILPAREFNTLLRTLGSAERVWSASSAALAAAGIRPALARTLAIERKAGNPGRETDFLNKEGVVALPLADRRYPPLLRRLPDPPPILFIRGAPDALLTGFLLAAVGTRSVTRYGEAAARLICGPLAAAGIGIVSGLALGVDAVAHAAALDAGGLTIAVLGSGVDRGSVGPKSNSALAERIVSRGGALVSEYPPGVGARKHHFPLRNRIIAGLCPGTIVIEAAERSGALITAAAALEYDRDVFAVPGPITQAASAGTNALIGQGAIPVGSADNILQHYGLEAAARTAEPRSSAGADDAERAVCGALADGPLDIDSIAVKTGLSARAVSAASAALEISGHIEKIGNQFCLRFDRRRQRRLL